MTNGGKGNGFVWAWLGLFGAALALYTLTLQRECGWQDSGWFQYRAVVEPYVVGDYTADLGLALGHPTYIALLRGMARLFAACPVWGVNWVSALGMAVAVANVGFLTFLLTGRRSRFPGVVAGVLLAFSHVVWWLSTIAEVYTCVAALLTTELICLLALAERPTPLKACLLAALAGLHWGFHNFALLALPVYACVYVWLMLKRKLSVAVLFALPACFLAAAWPNVRMIADFAGEAGWREALISALVGKYSPEVLCLSPRWLPMVKLNAALFSLNFLSPAWLLFAAGLWRCAVSERRWERTLLLAVLGVHGLFFVRYFVADQALFAVPTLTLMAVVAGIGAEGLSRHHALRAPARAALLALLAAVPVFAYLGVNRLLHLPRFAVANRRALPFRDEMRYWALPWKHNEHSACLFREAVLAETEPDAVVVADSTAVIVLELEKMMNPDRVGARVFLENRERISVRPDAQLLSEYYRANDRRAWYTVTPLRGYLADCFLDGSFTFEKQGALYRILPAARRPGGAREPL